MIPISDEALCKVTYRNEGDADAPNITYRKGWDAADAIDEGWTDEQIDRLLSLAETHASSDPAPAASPALFTDMKLWHTPGRAAFASIRRNGHWEHHAVDSKAFASLLAHRHFQEEGKAPSGTALDDLKRQYQGQALFEGDEHACFVRLGEAGGTLYLDLGAPDWSAVEIDSNGWHVVTESPVKFTRSNGARALPAPEPGTGDIALLRRFVNVETEDDFRLAVAWLLGCLHPKGPLSAPDPRRRTGQRQEHDGVSASPSHRPG